MIEIEVKPTDNFVEVTITGTISYIPTVMLGPKDHLTISIPNVDGEVETHHAD